MTNLPAAWQPAPPGFKHVVSVSLGSSKRNAREEIEVLGQGFILERIGTDGDSAKMVELFAQLDGKVDAFGLGGADLAVVSGGKRYIFNNVRKLVAGIKQTPLLDGSGLKNTLEREAVMQLDPVLNWKTQKVLMVSAVDRFGMAEALSEVHADVVYGDVIFGLGIDYPLRSISALRRVAGVVLPIVTKLPQDWFYPTGEKQEVSVVSKGTKYYSWADVLAGDTHYVKRYAPQDLGGKTVLTQTITGPDRDWMVQHGVKRLITTTPRIGSRNFATNVMEAMFVALAGKKEALSGEEYLGWIRKVDFKPQINEF